MTIEYKRDACGWCEGREYCSILWEEPDCENCPLAMQCVCTPQFAQGNCDHMQKQWQGVLSPTIETDKGVLVPDLQRKITCHVARELLIENLQGQLVQHANPHQRIIELNVNEGLFRNCSPHISRSSMWHLSCPRCHRTALLGYVMRPRTSKEREEKKGQWVTQISMACPFCGLDEKVDVP